MIKSLKATQNNLADSKNQIEVLERGVRDDLHLPSFASKMEEAGLYPLRPTAIEIFQMNVGKMCNQVCKHCHVDAGPDRKEIMTRETMEDCLKILAAHPELTTVDLTGGAPEMNPHFRWFVEECTKLGKKTMVRCNLTIIVANKKYYDLPQFFKDNQVEVVSSLPFYTADKTDRQRGNGVFADSIKALQMLNEVGYGKPGTGLVLNLVYNPNGAFLPADQAALEAQYKEALLKDFGIVFNALFAITNLPVSRFLDYLLVSGNYGSYMEKLVNAFNPVAAQSVMCRGTLSVGWDGYIYDCDFNQMLDLKLKESNHVSQFSMDKLRHREIILNEHCYGCTAGSGSSCGGATV
ncbi:MAG TPA: arsenosugar biosynthesis radical SAM (seleno)protein ArsS [Luteibaculaceae bacterium]|nr:arsenosugar biosynthesis radical SAM (seleno)protein ArsS [Luteibaculaceae bacterium]